MKKGVRDKGLGLKGIAIFKIFLLVSMSFALAFIFSGKAGIVSAGIIIENGRQIVVDSNGVDSSGVQHSGQIYSTPTAANKAQAAAAGPAASGSEGVNNIGAVGALAGFVGPSAHTTAFGESSVHFWKSTTGDEYTSIGDTFYRMHSDGSWYTVGKTGDYGVPSQSILTEYKDLATRVPDDPRVVSFTNAAENGLIAPPSTITNAGGGTAGNLFGDFFKTKDNIAWGKGLVDGVTYGAAAFGIGMVIGSAIGLQGDAKLALSSGLGVAAATYGFLQHVFTSFWAAAGPAAILGFITFAALYKKETVQNIVFTCEPWQAPVGGQNCEKCNADPLKPCSEYRCKSLGQACQIVNANTPNEKCVWVSPSDVDAPIITPAEESLRPIGLHYEKHDSLPPSRGTKIVDPANANGCLKAYTHLAFGINLDGPAACKLDYNHTAKFEDMRYDFGDNAWLYNHTITLGVPGPENGTFNSPILENNGQTNFYVRCKDANGNSNAAEFAIQFCVDKSPDTTPPVIDGSSIPSSSYVRAGVDNSSVDLYVNEQASCKWSINDRDYSNMENSFSCSATPTTKNSNLEFICSATLTGIKDMADNTYYIKCKDAAGNEMVQSDVFVLKGSQPLSIIHFGPNATISGSTNAVPVDLTIETNAGAEEGKAKCFFSQTNASGSFVEMVQTDSYLHKQTLALAGGDYTYYYRCIDSGNNAATAMTSFHVFVDKQAPIVTRVYKQEGPVALKIITNENAECRYSFTDCNYEFLAGQPMINNPPAIKTVHFAEWKPDSTYYIKCMDQYNNTANPDECSITASASQLD